MAGLSFAFDPSKGETPDTIAKKRAIAEAIAARAMSGAPRNVGEGLNAVGQALLYRQMMRRADSAQREGSQGASAAFSSLFGGNFPEAPAAASSGASMPDVSGLGENDIYSGFMDTVKSKISNPYALAAIAATGKHESGYSPRNAVGTWADPSESGKAGNAGGIMSWRADRLNNLQQFAGGDLSPQKQAEFFLQENPELIASLGKAGSVEEAMSLMNNAWRFAGYDRQGGEAGARLATANALLPNFNSVNSNPVPLPDANLNARMGTVAPQSQPPAAVQRVAQAMPEMAGNMVQQPGSPDANRIMQVLSNPFLSDSQKRIAELLLNQTMQANDPMRQMQLEKGRLELEQMRNPTRDLINAGKGRIYNPNSGEWLTAPDMGTDAPTVQSFYDEATGQSYKAQWNPNSRSWDRVGGTKAPSGMSLRTNADGTVEFVQGTGAGQKLTEQQGKDVVYYTRGMDADAQLADLDTNLADFRQTTVGSLPMGVGNYLRNPEFRQAKQAADSFLTAVLRKDTGAAITPQEFEIYGPMFLPVPGDDPATIEQKRRARQVALLAIRSGLGTAEAIGEANKLTLGIPDQKIPKVRQPTVIDGYTIEEVE